MNRRLPPAVGIAIAVVLFIAAAVAWQTLKPREIQKPPNLPPLGGPVSASPSGAQAP